jgi:hypothetical protein
MFTTIQTSAVLRNYILLVATVFITGMGLTDVCTNPMRLAQQDRLDNYGQYVGVGLVAMAQHFVR